MKKYLILCCSSMTLFFCGIPSIAHSQVITVVFVIDGFGYHVVQKLRPFLQGGLKELLEQGINYTNTYYPHARPCTASGHAALATGVLPDTHGIIANSWIKKDGTKVHPFTSNDAKTQELSSTSKNGTIRGKSPEKIMVDSISDQLMLHAQPNKPCAAYAISFKHRAAIPLAGKLGKAIWFNYSLGKFTSSKAYFDTAPPWLSKINKKLPSQKKRWVSWKKALTNKQAYNFRFINDYRFAFYTQLVGNKIPIKDMQSPKRYKKFTTTPTGQKMLFSCAEQCLENLLKENPHQSILLWVSISSLDKLGHWFGPDSLEYTDLVYHLDQQLKTCMQTLQKKVPKTNIIFMLTADHGISPIPEYVQEQGIAAAHRIHGPTLVNSINKEITEKYHIDTSIIFDIQPPQVYCNEAYLNTLPLDIQHSIIHDIKQELFKVQGIRHVWTRDERNALSDQLPSLLTYYKHQHYPGRDGLLTVHIEPYTQIIDSLTGTDHQTPYEYNTHVPLIVYQKGRLEKKEIESRTWSLQLAPTIAHLFDIPRPSSSVFDKLPGIATRVYP